MVSKQDDLSLKNLGTYDSDANKVERQSKLNDVRRERELYKQKYGSQWFKKYAVDKGLMPDYDITLKETNEFIYLGREPFFIDWTPRLKMCQDLYAERTHALYGDAYDELIHHEPGDIRVVELLLSDAVKTGKWRELPDELQSDYKTLVGSDSK